MFNVTGAAHVPKIIHASTCPTCCRPAAAPFRVYDARGKVLSGCVDHFHTGHLVTPSESAMWHARPEAKRLRAQQRAMRDGYMSEAA